jgi:murein DD-endopeptidase MepM/ murein hydrolase activator NlpD
MPVRKSLLIAVFLLLVILSANFIFFNQNSFAQGEKGVLGGPQLLNSGQTSTVIQSLPQISATSLPETNNGAINNLLNDDTMTAANIGPSHNSLFSRPGIIIYDVQKGDTLPKIAGYFNISIQTILWANPSIAKNYLYRGEQLVILPISGVLHQVQNNETWESISALYGISLEELRLANHDIKSSSLIPGTNLIIPNGKPVENYSLNLTSSALPNLKSYFVMPAYGFNWGILHDHNAVDIANNCGTPIVASADGLVVDAASSGYNGGYGNYVLIEHPNGVETRYAHLQSLSVSIGDYVKQNQQIGLMGKTGDATGCHVHFEVLGAKNPFATA